jgi:hypothetical protein
MKFEARILNEEIFKFFALCDFDRKIRLST